MAGQQKVISSTFNVSTVDETVSLQAQYAPNDNPTSSQIHDTWQSGDLYMRTKMTNETTWSDWHKIVGENGGETDFSFAISSNATSTNSSTPPSDCTSESSWHDTPQAVTSQKPYLWMRIKKKVWNESTQQYDVSSTSYARLSAESNYIADLDNEMDSIECNNLGYPKSVQTVTTKATLYRGSTLLSSTIAVYDDDTSGVQYTNGTAKDGITISWANATGVINVAFATSTIRTEKEVFCIKLTTTDSGQTIVRLLYLTVNCVRGTALYRLVPSTNTITKRKNGTLVPSGNITCNVQKIVNGVISTPAASEYSLTMKVNDGTEQSYESVAISSITSNIEYILRVPQTSGTIVDRERVPLLIDGSDGLNAFVVDLENEMTNVALTEGGNTLTAVDFYFKVRAFYGTSNVLSDNECTVSASCSDSNVTLTTTAAKTTGIRVQVAQNVALANSTDITVTVTHTTYGTRTVVFTLAGVRGGENAILQELLPSLSDISFARQTDGSLTPASRSLTLSIKKTQGGVTTIQTLAEANLTIRWSASSMPATASDGNNWGNGTSTGISWNNITMNIANNASASNIYIAAFKFVEVNTYVLVDRETIPVIKDGNNGEDALTLVLDTYAIAFPTDSNYSVESQITYTVGARMYLGNSSIPRTITSLTASLDVADGDIDVSRTSPANGVVIDLGEARFANIIGVNVTAVCADGTRTAKIILTAAPKGEHGTRGKVGRFFYYAGAFDVTDSTTQFVVNDAQSPYFAYNNQYWVYNPETNPSGGYATMAQMGTPLNSSADWKIMTNDFKYLITEAIFGSYAHFGSFIINGDWMISQHGVIYDTNGGIHTIDTSHSYGNYNVNNAYTLFDVDYPNSSKPNANNFVPNFAVDGRTGATYQNKAHIRGELDVRELGQNAGWILSPYLQDYYKIPSIDGFDKDGILTMRLLFDGDDSDGYAPREGGGLLINEKKWNASTQKYEPYNVARYNREAWCVSSTDHPDDSYMFGGMSSEEPYIHGKTYIQSNQTHKEFYLGITSLGLWFQSDSWQTYRSNMQDGEVYVDDWDNLMVKNSRSYKQFNIVRGNCTLPNDCPIGTVYYVKGTGSTTVSVTSGSNDWIEGWDDNNSKGNSVGIQSNSVQFVKTDTHIWTMFIGI